MYLVVIIFDLIFDRIISFKYILERYRVPVPVRSVREESEAVYAGARASVSATEGGRVRRDRQAVSFSFLYRAAQFL